MLGKIVELSGIALEKGFEVIEGIEINKDGMKRFGFGTIIPTGVFFEGTRLTYIYSACSEEENNMLFEQIVATDEDYMHKPDSDVEERFLWVIIPYSSGIESKAKKIAGRDATEGIFEMHEGDTLKVSKAGAVSEKYMVAKAGNELFLVKKNR